MDLSAKTSEAVGRCSANNVAVVHGATIGQGDKTSPDGNQQVGYPVIEDGWIAEEQVVASCLAERYSGGSDNRGAAASLDVPPRSMSPATRNRREENCCIEVKNRFRIRPRSQRGLGDGLRS
jgi:hypothetical protein